MPDSKRIHAVLMESGIFLIRRVQGENHFFAIGIYHSRGFAWGAHCISYKRGISIGCLSRLCGRFGNYPCFSCIQKKETGYLRHAERFAAPLFRNQKKVPYPCMERHLTYSNKPLLLSPAPLTVCSNLETVKVGEGNFSRDERVVACYIRLA